MLTDEWRRRDDDAGGRGGKSIGEIIFGSLDLKGNSRAL